MFISILDPLDNADKEAAREAFFTDLNLNRIFERISKLWGSDIKDFYNYFPSDRNLEQYRRDVYTDIDREGVYGTLCAAYEIMLKRRSYERSKDEAKQNVQIKIWNAAECALYCDAVLKIDSELKNVPFTSEGMKNFMSEMGAYVSSEEFIKLKDTAYRLRETIDSIGLTLTYENKRVSVALNEDVPVAERITEAGFLNPGMQALADNPFVGSTELDGLERDIIAILIKKKPELFDLADTFWKETKDYAKEWVIRFFDEIPFYLSFMRFEREMIRQGAHFTTPSSDTSRRMEAEGLYDLALFIANRDRDKDVVDNDFYYDGGELFFVLTGPNQGGKTTFARSLGQLVFFSKMGLRVPARSANVPFFTNIITHFSVEESVETGRGKLMEELVRLSPMMRTPGENAFVIINELFTTAANYDACIMGKRVLSHFIGKGCHGIYVTHLSELLESEEKAVGLCAQLDDNGIQTFRILRRVMEYNNCAVNQVVKYGLTYDRLKERLSLR